jgi:hypothetical protein
MHTVPLMKQPGMVHDMLELASYIPNHDFLGAKTQGKETMTSKCHRARLQCAQRAAALCAMEQPDMHLSHAVHGSCCRSSWMSVWEASLQVRPAQYLCAAHQASVAYRTSAITWSAQAAAVAPAAAACAENVTLYCSSLLQSSWSSAVYVSVSVTVCVSQ